jgi:1,4-alpha-glucan branching enzyme
MKILKNETRLLTYLLVMLFMNFSWFSQLFGQSKSFVKHTEWSRSAFIYEVNLRQYTPGGTIKEFREHLPLLKELGVGILWFMPIHPIGELNRKGTLGSYYSVKDYFDIDASYGTKDEFRELVNEIHSMGMYIILDWVANHTSWDNELTKSNPEFFKKDKEGKFVPPVEDWHDVISLDYSNRKVWDYMSGALEYWVKEFNIDGYRCDVAGMLPIEFWDFTRPRLDQIKPVFMLAEDEAPKMHNKAFDMTYSWDLMHLMNRVAKGESKGSEILEMIIKEEKKYPIDSYRMRFITNHDENSWNGTEFERLGEFTESFAVLTGVVPGMFLVYSGQEAGLNKRLSFFEKDLIDWKEHRLGFIYKKLGLLKKQNKSLWNGTFGGDFYKVKSNNNDDVIVFMRRKGDKKILAIFNLSSKKQELKINDSNVEGNYLEWFTENRTTFTKTSIIGLRPYDYRVFVLE